jgi:hypothetical protein
MMDRRKVSKNLNLGDVLHLVQIATLLFCIGVAYQKFDANAAVTNVHTQQLNRIEHYLSAKDPDYWNVSKRDE